MAMTGRQAAQHYEQRQAQALTLIQGYEELGQYVDGRMRELNEQVAGARRELAQAYLPTLSAEALARAAELSGFLGFQKRDPIRSMEHERTVLERTVRRIEAEPRYQQRELLAGPDGTLRTKLIELDEQLAPWRAECEKFESQDGFVELVHARYDTPDYDGSWWQATYWKQWSRGDAICKALGMDDFGDDVLPAYQKAAEQRDFWQREVDAIQNQLNAVHELVREHDAAVARLPRLEAIYREQSQEYLASYLEGADAGLLEEWLVEKGGRSRPVLASLRKLAGLKAKQRYFEELLNQGLTGAISQLRGRAHKYARKVQKYLRPKHYGRRVGDHELDHKFGAKYDKYRQRQSKLRSLVDRVYLYDDYDRFCLDNDPELWWYEFTHKAPPPYLPRVRNWYQRHPQPSLRHDDWNDLDEQPAVTEEVATAAVARELDEVGYLS